MREMSRSVWALISAILILSLSAPGLSRKYGGGSHRYPSSHGGLSGGGGGHSYPSSHGLSGSGSSHIHPTHVAPSHSGNHAYPSSGGGSHSYPASTGLSGTSGNRYPSSSGSSGSHGYPASPGLSGNNNRGGYGSTTNVHHHYHYNPPQQIHYAPRGGTPVSYPVYHGTPPTYVYHYKDSGSKYSSLLAGLALLNLGALTATAFSHRRNSEYRPAPGEICKFGMRRENGDYEETKIDCQLITSFIWAEEDKKRNGTTSTNVVTTTVTNTTTVNTTNELPPIPSLPVSPTFTMLPNGTLVQVNVTTPDVIPPIINGTVPGGIALSANGSVTTSSVTVTTTNTTTVVDALDPKNKGPPVQVTDGMKCYVIRTTRTSNMRHTVPCGLLQTYSAKSLTNASVRHTPVFGVVVAFIIAFALY